jgi:hypothetical protein
MGMKNFGVPAVHSDLILGWHEALRRTAATSKIPASRDVAAVAIFCAIGLIASLVFVLFVPGAASAVIAPMP